MSDNPLLRHTAPGIAGLRPYVPGKPIAELERELGISDSVKLASNENPLGASDKVRDALSTALGEIARYPDGSGHQLRLALAQRFDVDPRCITLGNGSNDVLDLVARTFLAPGCEAVFSEHAFAVYPLCTQAAGADSRVAPAHDGSHGPRFGHDLAAMSALVGERTRVVFIANPNNPTGTWLASAELEAFIAALPRHLVVVVDEAYFEYVDEPDYPDTSTWLDRYPNLLVTRTFSKAYGLAGLRLGFGLSHPDLAGLLNRVRQPFNVNSLALLGGLAALSDPDHIRRSVVLNRTGMAQLLAGFKALGLRWIPSVGNFVCVDLGRPAKPVDEALQRQGCIVRPIANYGLPDHLRVTVGLPQENRRFLDALKRSLA